jgi:hypothetical protein
MSENNPIPKPTPTPKPVPKAWVITKEYVQISSATVVSLNGILATILTILTAVNTDPNTQKTIGIAFGATITIMNILLHLGLQIALVISNEGSIKAEQQEENFIDNV